MTRIQMADGTQFLVDESAESVLPQLAESGQGRRGRPQRPGEAENASFIRFTTTQGIVYLNVAHIAVVTEGEE